MTHMHIPSLPPPRDTVRHTPKHRRSVTYAGPFAPDRMSNATCPDFGKPRCYGPMCPRHDATAYSMHMARHAVDTIPHRSV